jgi:hypothetical protein
MHRKGKRQRRFDALLFVVAEGPDRRHLGESATDIDVISSGDERYRSRAPAMRAELAIAWLTGSLPGCMVMLGIGRLHEDIAQHVSNPVNDGVDVHAYAHELRVNMEADARGHRERSRRPTCEENSDGLGWKPHLPQNGVAANSGYMIVSIVRVRSPTAGRGNETFGDHVPDLTLRRARARREITNVHDRSLSTKVMSNPCGPNDGHQARATAVSSRGWPSA